MEKIKVSSFKPVQRLGKLLKSERKNVYLILFYAVINGVIVLTLPLGIQAIMNYVLGGRVSSSWVILILIVMAGLAISGLLQIAQITVTERLQQRIFSKSSFEFAVRLPRMKMEAVQNRYAPEMMNQFFDTVSLQKGLAKLLVDYPTATLQVLFGLILISVYHPFFLLFSLSVTGILYLLFRYSGPIGVQSSLNESTNKYEVAHWLEELARTMGTFKLAGLTNLPLLKVDKLILGYLYYRRKHFKILIFQFKTMVAFKVVTVGALLVMGSLLLMEGEISLGQFVAAEIVIIQVMNSIEKLIIGLEDIYDVLTSLEKLGGITDMPLDAEIESESNTLQESEAFEVELDNVIFGYPGSEKLIMDGVDLKVKAGEKIVLTGKQGSGKTTLLQLMTGIYEDYKGEILYNGTPLKRLNQGDVRLHIGDNIWQETIFKGTVRENISLGKKGVTDEQIRKTLKSVGGMEGVQSLPDGLNTVLFPEGIKIPKSLGKKIILARTIASQPKLLLLELETHFMTKSEKERFYDFILSEPWTMMAVSWDESFMEKADRILFLEQGKVVFSGSLNELNQSEYAKYIR